MTTPDKKDASPEATGAANRRTKEGSSMTQLTPFTYNDQPVRVAMRIADDMKGAHLVSTPGGDMKGRTQMTTPGGDQEMTSPDKKKAASLTGSSTRSASPMTDIQRFAHDQFGTIRTVTDEQGRTLFCGRDIATALGYENPAKAVRDHARQDGGPIRYPIVDALGRTQGAIFISEGDLYRLIASSKLPAAQQFETWIFDEVLPSIRKHGGYLTPEKAEEIISNPDVIIELAQTVKREKAARLAMESLVHELEPKADMYDRFLGADGTYSIGNVAKMVGLSQNKLFDRLRNSGVLIAKGAMRNTPYQRYMHHFSVHPYDFERSDGTRGTSYTTRVQPSGIQFICRKLNCHLITEEAA